MRVIAGTCRSLPLQTLPGRDTRPTTDRIKETLFNMLQVDVPGSRFLDLFAGSGAIGIEALSRGAAHCVFVDQSRQAAAVIRKNLDFCKLTDKAEVLTVDALSAVRTFSGAAPFTLVFLDPPYRQGLEQQVLQQLRTAPCITCETLIVIEAALETDFSNLDDLGYICAKVKEYKTNKHVFVYRNT